MDIVTCSTTSVVTVEEFSPSLGVSVVILTVLRIFPLIEPLTRALK